MNDGGELYTFRLDQLEKKVSRLEDLANSISRDQLKQQVSESKLRTLETKTDGALKRIDELRDRFPPVELMSSRVNHVLKILLSAFAALLVATLLWAAKNGVTI